MHILIQKLSFLYLCSYIYSIWNNHWHLCKGIINKWSCYLFKGSFLTNIWCNCKGTCIIALFSLYRGFDLHCAVSLRHYVVDMLLWSCEENKVIINFDFRRGAKKSGHLDYPLQSYGPKVITPPKKRRSKKITRLQFCVPSFHIESAWSH